MEFEPSETDMAAMAGMDAQILAEERAEEQRRQQVLAEVKSLVSKEVYAEIICELTECCYTFGYEITAQPAGALQDNGAGWGQHYVNQTTNGGMSGDEYAGTVAIPVGEGRFFQFGYAM
ncbi:hypothetical protein [Duganella vulcania]|uniref:Uncharacterized protein n=1 Tax=Duganella vulcania TaxID=2692166 RepID=A0A845GGC9_9BURK|nr:hypothetical protein [Duganella vulcania]MYM92462.1 hypothetical protein [Duganella vulcania]